MAKDRWNREAENLVRAAYETDWRRVRERVEDRLAGLLERGTEEAREAVEKGRRDAREAELALGREEQRRVVK